MTRNLFAALAAITVAASLSGCATDIRDYAREPHMSAVGSGLTLLDEAAPLAPAPPPEPLHELRVDPNRVNLFRDLRAMAIGDVVTVAISLDDKAIIGNETDRSKEAKIDTKWSLLFDFIPGLRAREVKASARGENQIDSQSSMQGKGSINRSEQIRFSIAAVVTAVLPNGNLILQGSQEMRVNQELRVISIAGIARPRDISKDNVIAYDKIAEARVSYGGRGRLSEVQQPAWGHQLYDIFLPF